MQSNPKKILIVSPAFNESEILPKFISAIQKLRENLSPSYDLKLCIVNDGSTDNTLEKLNQFVSSFRDSFAYVSFTSNFGHQPALIAGMISGSQWADAIITMDSDLEHPVELIPQMIQKWSDEKLILVNTQRNENQGLSFQKRLFSKIYYKITALLTGLELTQGQADFRLWDASVIRAMEDGLRNVWSLRVFAAWLPGKKAVLCYNQLVQKGRVSRFTFKKNWELALGSVVRFSNVPLLVILTLGVLGLFFSMVYGAYIIVQVIQGDTVPGWTSIMLTVIVMSCLQLISLGIVAMYLQRLVFAKDLPLYLIEKTEGFLNVKPTQPVSLSKQPRA